MRPDQKQLLDENGRIIIFDGVCNLCEYSIQFIIKHDAKAKFKFVSAQSELGRKLQEANGIDTIKDGTVILIKNKLPLVRSDAALEIAKDLDGIWRYLYIFKILPRKVRDYLYSVVSKYRYQWFGKKEECLLPDKSIKDRFLHVEI
jgi:predicted DCC family thiol-disulfide oxidoreductase YuxK